MAEWADGSDALPGLGYPEGVSLLQATHLHSSVAVPDQLHMAGQAVCLGMGHMTELLP